MEKGMAARRFLTSSLVLLLFAWLLYTAESDRLLHVDEGIHLAATRQVLNSGIPGIHFNYPKLGVYVTAAWVEVFGKELVSVRFFVALQLLAVALLVFYWSKSLAETWAGYFSVSIFAVCSGPLWPLEGGDWFGVILVLSGFLVLARSWEKGGSKDRASIIGAGAMFSLAGWGFFPDLALISLVGTMIASWFRGRKGTALLLLAGALIPATMILGSLAVGGALFQYLDLAFWAPLTRWHQFREMALPPPLPFMKQSRYAYYGETQAARLLYGVPLAVGIALAHRVVVGIKGNKRQQQAKPGSGTRSLAGLAALAGLATMYPRADLDHLAVALPMMLPLLAQMLFTNVSRSSTEKDSSLSFASGTARSIAAILVALTWAAAGLVENRARLDFDRRNARQVPVLRGFALRPDTADTLTRLGEFLQRNVTPGELVFAYPDFSYFYYLFDMPPPTRFLDQMFGWIGTDEEKEVIGDLERFGVRIAVRLGTNRPADGRTVERYLPLLAGYMNTRFKEAARFGPVAVLIRTDEVVGERRSGLPVRF